MQRKLLRPLVPVSRWFVALAAALAANVAPAAEVVPALREETFAARSLPAGATLFTAITPEQSGVVTVNHYADPEMWGQHYQELVYGAMGCGVAVGDFDNDGLPDLFAVSKTERARLFRNLGGWKFVDVTDDAGLGVAAGGWAALKDWIGWGDGEDEPLAAWQQGATFADINNDGWLDLYLCRFAAPNLLYINQRDGTFLEEGAARGLAIDDASGMAAFCDYDRDGWLDVYIQTNMRDAAAHPHGQRDYLFRNQGDGTYANVTETARITGESSGHSATWWDYDDDGWPDLYVANDYATPDVLYRNNGDGTFTNVIEQAMPHLPYYAMGADVGDVDNDGRLDLFVGDMAPSSHEKDQRGMAGSRARSQVYEDDALAPQLMRNALFLNTGRGVFREAAYLAGLAATDWTWSVRFEDFDNDSRVDLHVTNGMIREYHNADLLDRIMAVEDRQGSRRVVRASPVLAEQNFAFRNNGDLRFEDVSAAWGLDQTGVSFGAATGDFDGDGDLDLVFTNYEAGVTLLRNDSSSGHRAIIVLRGTNSNRFGVGATVRLTTAAGSQVRSLVLARGYLSSSEPVVHFGLGEETRIERIEITWPGGHRQSLTDLPGDRRLIINEPATPVPWAPPPNATDFAQFVDVTSDVNLEMRRETPPERKGAPPPWLPLRRERRGPALAIGDWDGDQRDDVVIDPRAALLIDVDGDGKLEWVETEDAPGAPLSRPDWWRQNSGGQFERAAADGIKTHVLKDGVLAAADFDRDGKLDVFLGRDVTPSNYPQSPRHELLVNRGGKFEDVIDAVAPGLRDAGIVNSAIWSDVDVDGWIDLVIACEWGGVRWWRNHGGTRFEDRSEAAGFTSAGSGWWTALAAADFNHDGRPDFVVGNLGLNTPYQATASHPVVLLQGDFRGSGGGAPQLLEGYYEGDRFLPRRARHDLVAQFPALARRFPRTDDFARATLEDIVGAERLASARRWVATELRSGVLASAPDGTYRFSPLPRVAQIAPIQGVVAGDFDGDGHADIFAVQNSHAPIASVGRFDGGVGQWLRGDGRGAFAAVPPADSGLLVPGDGEALAVLDLGEDGWPDFVVTRHDRPPMVFQNRGVTGRHSLAVKLRGPAGNTAGIGARVVLECADGTSQTAAIVAGSGYLSQSAAACFFGYADDNPPRVIRVHWPSGQSSEQAVSAGAVRVIVAYP